MDKRRVFALAAAAVFVFAACSSGGTPTPASQTPPPPADGVASTPNEPDQTTAQAPTAVDDGVTHANPQ